MGQKVGKKKKKKIYQPIANGKQTKWLNTKRHWHTRNLRMCKKWKKLYKLQKIIETETIETETFRSEETTPPN